MAHTTSPPNHITSSSRSEPYLVDGLLRNEAANEIKDRVSTLTTDIKHLKGVLHTISNESRTGMLPPLNPAALETVLTLCEILVNKVSQTSQDSRETSSTDIQGDSKPAESKHLMETRAKSDDEKSKRSGGVDFVESLLEMVGNVLTQRREGTTLEHLIYRFPERFEVTGLHKVYFSIDILTYNYMARLADTNKILVEVPNTVLGHEFSYNGYFVIIPRSEIFRTRNWPLIAHEVGHYLLEDLFASTVKKIGDEKQVKGIVKYYRDFVANHFERPTPENIAQALNLPFSFVNKIYKRITIDGLDKVEAEAEFMVNKFLSSYFTVKDRTSLKEIWERHHQPLEGLKKLFDQEEFKELRCDVSSLNTEHLCDAIGVALSGPAFALCLSLSDRSEVIKYSRTHPPDAVRSYFSLRMLRDILCISDDTIMNIENQFERLLDSDRSTRAYKETLLQHQSAFKETVLGLIPPKARYSAAEWDAVKSVYESGIIDEVDGMQPYQLMNLVWYGRIRSDAYDRQIRTETYEAKSFDVITTNLFKQYPEIISQVYPQMSFLRGVRRSG